VAKKRDRYGFRLDDLRRGMHGVFLVFLVLFFSPIEEVVQREEEGEKRREKEGREMYMWCDVM
jgi:hypothetical protein